MPPVATHSEVAELERILDRIGLRAILRALSEIATEKELHIAENWQNYALAKLWARAANRLDKLGASISDL